MSITINNQEDIEKMKVAGKLASEVLDFITPFVKPNVTTEQINTLCHDFMTKKQKTIPAPLNYAPPGHSPVPKSICTSVNNQICHGIPGEKILKMGPEKVIIKKSMNDKNLFFSILVLYIFIE